MSILIKGVNMPKGTNLMLLISPYGDVWEMGDLLGDDKLIEGAKAVPVLPHGRCIEVDVLIKVLRTKANNPLNQEIKPDSWAFAFECLADVVEDVAAIFPVEEVF